MAASVLLFLHPLCVLVVVLGLAAIDAGMFCVMGWWRTPLDTIAFIGLEIAVGFSVDYLCHTAHAFEHAAGAPHERAAAALRSIGPSIFKAGLSTFIGICSLAFAPAAFFRTFFALLFSMIVFGLVGGLALFPAAASLVGGLVPQRRRPGAGVSA